MPRDGHEYQTCDDPYCPRFPCRVYKEGAEYGRNDGFGDGFGEGYGEGFAAGMAAAREPANR